MIEDFYESIRIQDFPFSTAASAEVIVNRFVRDNWPIVYLIYSDLNKEAYVGETTNAQNRIKNHLSNDDRRRLNKITIIGSDRFNKSAALDIEANFIKYLAGDGKYKLQNGNAGMSHHPYYQKEIYTQLFRKLWEKFQEKNLVDQSLHDIHNSDLFKYSPYKSLSEDQKQTVLDIITLLTQQARSSIIVNGGAGTGKTILAVYLMKLLVSDPESQNILDKQEAEDINEFEQIRKLKSKFIKPEIGLVVPMTSLRKTLKKVFRSVKGLSASMVIGPSDVMRKHYDILIVDEAHRLRQRKNITNYESFDNANAALGFDHNGTELDWIIKQSTNQIYFYDKSQSIKPSDIDESRFTDLKWNSKLFSLQSQHRVLGGLDYVQFVDDLLALKLKESSKKTYSDYEIRLFSSLTGMRNALLERERDYGLCRLLSGYSWKWESKKKGQEHLPDITLEGINLQWNTTNEDWINSPKAIDEVGCIHTSQGYDLNYAGVIFGTEIHLDPKTNRLEIEPKNYHDSKGKNGIKDPEKLREYILNIYKTMMLRGIKGTYLYICDDKLREYVGRFVP